MTTLNDNPEVDDSNTNFSRSHYSGPQPSHYVTLDFTPTVEEEPLSSEMENISLQTTPLPVRPMREKRVLDKTHVQIPPARPPPPKISSRFQLEKEGQLEVDEGLGSDKSISRFDDKTKNLTTAICKLFDVKLF